MKRKGFDFKFARHLTFRNFIPDLDGDQLQSDWRNLTSDYRQYSVIIPVRAVFKAMGLNPGERSEPKAWFEMLDKVPCLPFSGWSRTNMVYGVYRKQNRSRHVLIDGESHLLNHYWTQPIYWVENASVYVATGHYLRERDPRKRAA